MYKISIIIPIFNVEKYIKKSLGCVLNQSFDSIEFILVNDCSTDNSIVIVKELLANHSRAKDVFIYENESNQGPSGTRNAGLEKATGEYIFFVDADDEIIPDCISLHYRAITEHNADFTIGETKLIGTRTVHVKNMTFLEKEGEEILLSYLRKEWNNAAWNKLYRRSVIQNLRFDPIYYFEDNLWSYRLALITSKMVVVPEKTYHYIIRDNSITTSKISPRKITGALHIINEFTEEEKKVSDNKQLKNAYSRHIMFWQLNTSLQLLYLNAPYKEKKYFYAKIKSSSPNRKGIYFFILGLPFWLFFILMTPAYKLYKLLNKWP